MQACERSRGEPSTGADVARAFRDVMREVPASVAIVTSRDHLGQPHGMAATAVIPVSMEPASVLVAVNEGAGLHPVLRLCGRLCINYLADAQQHLIEPFSRTALRHQRFTSGDWRDAGRASAGLPWLPAARANVFAEVDRCVDYGTHTLFIARVTRVVTPEPDAARGAPLIWVGGRFAAIDA